MKNQMKIKGIIKAKVNDRFYSPFFAEFIVVRLIISDDNWYFSRESDPASSIKAQTPLTFFEKNFKLYDRRKVRPEIRDLQFYEDVNMVNSYKKILFIFIFVLVAIALFIFTKEVNNVFNQYGK